MGLRRNRMGADNQNDNGGMLIGDFEPGSFQSSNKVGQVFMDYAVNLTAPLLKKDEATGLTLFAGNQAEEAILWRNVGKVREIVTRTPENELDARMIQAGKDLTALVKMGSPSLSPHSAALALTGKLDLKK